MKTQDLSDLQKLDLDEKTSTCSYGHFTVGPFERGYGHTIGNSLRRILLSSLEGYAITSVKIPGVLHEFSVIKGIKEDVSEIILNLKRVRVKLNSNSGVEIIKLKIDKPGKVTAKYFEINDSIKIMNPDQEIVNIDNDGKFEIEITVSSGNGYVLSEDLKLNDKQYNNDNIGIIFIDSLFSPITKVNYEVENMRVGQSFNYDKLIIEIWTDGSILPKCALKKSAEILKSRLDIFINSDKSFDSKNEKEVSDFFDSPIEILNISTRILNNLKKENIKTIYDIVKTSEEKLLKIDNFGKRSLDELKKELIKIGLNFGMKEVKTK
ncbi:MAG: DNA-directed RNA polymerase subunit alpha [Endomicrobium sp.]|jgi:DNA-directed RNA polymerase subunit alpha|nr:DNA-directed RNA polymerase subunit alpha [Endomicrobium sp.]